MDGDFGPATEWAVSLFQRRRQHRESGQVDAATFALLCAPMAQAVTAPSSLPRTPRTAFVQLARQHLRAGAREVGGANRGPWVRLYMDGNEGDGWPWCAGFVSHLLRQASGLFGQAPPIDLSFSCDLLAASATARGLLVSGRNLASPSQVKRGALFLVRRTAGDWTHTGIVTQATDAGVLTIEGNTNDEGAREGYEVCRRVRAYKDLDFVVW
jgi:hypothetical protein